MSNAKPMDYKKRLKDLRVDSDITQAQIADVLRVKQTTISNYEHGKRQYKIEDLVKLCKFYNVSPEYVLGFTNEYKSLSEMK
ncbi:MAG: helix-turn-helix domain-containing protein [Eubacterium sp.]|nr:helix-turn-helix domain-containing protein [Eubacterium sp.]